MEWAECRSHAQLASLRSFALSEMAQGILLTLYVQRMEASKVEESLAIEGKCLHPWALMTSHPPSPKGSLSMDTWDPYFGLSMMMRGEACKM